MNVSTDANLPYLRYRDVVVRYSELVYGLRGVSISIERGEFVFLVGPTGSGKSTLLKLLTGEVRATTGEVFLGSRDLTTLREADIPGLRRQMGIVPQDFGLLPNKRVWENVGYAMRAVGKTRREVRRLVPDILDSVSIGHRADAYPHELSGGEQQRVAIGRALINRPSLLVADEPTGNLDPDKSMEIMDLLLKQNMRGTTVVVATHDVAVVERVAQRVIRMEEGLVASDERPTVREVPPPDA